MSYRLRVEVDSSGFRLYNDANGRIVHVLEHTLDALGNRDKLQEVYVGKFLSTAAGLLKNPEILRKPNNFLREILYTFLEFLHGFLAFLHKIQNFMQTFVIQYLLLLK